MHDRLISILSRMLLPASLLLAGVGPARVAAASGDHLPNPALSRDADLETIPVWQGSFTFEGTTYPYDMVGRDPARTTHPTLVGVDVYPVRLTFADGQVLDGSERLRTILESPVFRRAPFATGTTQFGNAVQRATFWSQVAGSDWGVLLDPLPHRTLALEVPADKGRAFHLPGYAPLVAMVDFTWFDAQLRTALASRSDLHADAHRLALFAGLDVALINPDGSPAGGYHTVMLQRDQPGRLAAQTFAYASWVEPELTPAIRAQFGVTASDVSGISHEVVEWLNDPFDRNTVPAWPFPGPQGGCSPLLETGDPLEFRADDLFPVTLHGVTYHPQNEALLPWFARQVPSSAFAGAFSFPNTSLLSSPALVC